jgi:hypothetical protein
METEPKDQCRGMAPSETMKKVSAIDPMGLLGDPVDNDQEMREVEDTGNLEADPTAHKNVHVISASEGEDGEGSESGAQGGGSEHDNNYVTNSTMAGTPATHEKRFIIVDIAPPASPATAG